MDDQRKGHTDLKRHQKGTTSNNYTHNKPSDDVDDTNGTN